MAHPLALGLLRVLKNGSSAGAAFLISRTHICTCAHVVAEAQDIQAKGRLTLQFAQLKNAGTIIAQVVSTAVRPQATPEEAGRDLAILEIVEGLEAYPQVRPLPLLPSEGIDGRTLEAIGFPSARYERAEARAYPVGSGPVQLNPAGGDKSPWIRPGYSGGPVWDPDRQGVVGMVVEGHDLGKSLRGQSARRTVRVAEVAVAQEQPRTGYMLPSELLAEWAPGFCIVQRAETSPANVSTTKGRPRRVRERHSDVEKSPANVSTPEGRPGRETERPDVFLSHHPWDVKAATAIKALLESIGLTVFTCDDIPFGGNVVDERARALEGSRHFLALLSPAAVVGPWENFEVTTALVKGLTERKVNTLVPVLWKPAPLPAALISQKVCDLTVQDLETRKERLNQLCRQLLGSRQPKASIAEAVRSARLPAPAPIDAVWDSLVKLFADVLKLPSTRDNYATQLRIADAAAHMDRLATQGDRLEARRRVACYYLIHLHERYPSPQECLDLLNRHQKDLEGDDGDALDSVRKMLNEAKNAEKAPSLQPETQPETRQPSFDGLEGYRKAVCAQHQKLPLIGVNPELKLSLDIDEVYVPLRASVDRSLYHEQKWKGAEGPGCEESGDVDLAQAFTCAGKKRGLIILGDPGSGKTTLLKLLLVRCIQKGPESLGLPAGTVPVMLPLRELKGDQNLDDFMSRLLKENTHLRLTEDFPCALRKARPLVYLLDGLDEVPDEKERARVSKWIRSALDTHTTAWFAVTSRYAGYQGDARLDDHFLELNVRPLREAEARRLVGNFYRIVERHQAQEGKPALDEARLHAAEVDAKEKAEHLWSLLESDTYRTRRMRELQTNPLLLTIVCLVHQRHNSLPAERWRLYEQCVDTLLWHWQKAKNLTLPFEKLDHALRLLRPLAWWLHQQEQRRHASSDDVVKALGQSLSRLGVDGDRMSQFLREVRDRSGLLVGWGPDSYGFIHLGFQEYLTAVETKIGSYGSPRLLEELSKHFGESWWTEVILLLVSLPDPCLFEQLMGQLLQRDTFALPANQTLLADCVSDAAERAATPFLAVAADATRSVEVRYAALAALKGFKDEQKAEVIEGCRSLLKAKEQTLQDLARELLVARGEQVAAALEAGTVWIHPATGLEFVYVPAGSFMMGSERGLDNEKPPHQVTFARGFWMGKYPVTNEQYGRFLEGNRKHQKPHYWEDREWNGPRQPVVGVTWDDAKAYSQWADGVLRSGGERPPADGDAILLPSEAEFEYAARGPEGREYPWGKAKPTPELANFDQNVKKTTPVGQYPKGASWVGALDMAGNVWEWSADHWHDSYQGAPEDGSPWLANAVVPKGLESFEKDPLKIRVLRGGGWGNVAFWLRAAYRSRNDARDWNRFIGFRLVLSAVPGGSS